MNDMRSWQMAFLRQARSDWDAYQKTTELEWPHCHRLHYFQMVTEKLSKAFLVAGDSKLEDLKGSHAALVKFIRIMSSNRHLRRALGMKMPQQKAQFKSLLPLAHEIEHLAPALAESGPNPEYPWRDRSGNILAPADYHFPQMKRLHQTPQGVLLLKYAEIFLMRFEELFVQV